MRSVFFKSLLAAVTCTFVFSAYGNNQGDEHRDALWAETGIGTKTFKELFNDKNCYADALQLNACMGAMDELLANKTSKDNLILTTPAWLEHLKALPLNVKLKTAYTVERQLGSFEIVRTHSALSIADGDVDDSDLATETDLARKETRALLGYLSKNLPSIRKSSFPYNDVIAFARQTGGLTSLNEAYKAGMAFDIFRTQAIDAHAHFEPLKLMQEEQSGASANYVGVGLIIQKLHGKIVVVNPIEGSPAYQAGVHANDVIVNVEGVAADGKSADEIADVLRGKAGTPVHVVLKRGTSKVEVSLVRKKISQANVTSGMISKYPANTNSPTGYIKVRDFVTDNSCSQVKTAIEKLQNAGAKGLILDLRGNPGGTLQEAVCMSGLFVGNNKLIVEQRPEDLSQYPAGAVKQTVILDSFGKAIDGLPESGEWVDYYSGVERVAKVPAVVLIDAGSASASEIVSGSLHDYGAAVIVGQRSFGKASVQEGHYAFGRTFIDFTTVARFYMPGNASRPRHTTQIVGVLPDVEVYKVPHPKAIDMVAFREEDVSPVALVQLDNQTGPLYPALSQRLNACLKTTSGAEAEFGREQNSQQLAPDYQRLVAVDTLGCLRKSR